MNSSEFVCVRMDTVSVFIKTKIGAMANFLIASSHLIYLNWFCAFNLNTSDGLGAESNVGKDGCAMILMMMMMIRFSAWKIMNSFNGFAFCVLRHMLGQVWLCVHAKKVKSKFRWNKISEENWKSVTKYLKNLHALSFVIVWAVTHGADIRKQVQFSWK